MPNSLNASSSIKKEEEMKRINKSLYPERMI